METNVPNILYMEWSPASPRRDTRHQKIAPLTLLLILKWRSLAQRTHTCHLPGARPAPPLLLLLLLPPAPARRTRWRLPASAPPRAAAAPRRGAGRGRRHARRPAPPDTRARRIPPRPGVGGKLRRLAKENKFPSLVAGRPAARRLPGPALRSPPRRGD